MKKMVLEDADEQEMEMEIETPKSILVFLYSINSNCLFSNYQIWLFSLYDTKQVPLNKIFNLIVEDSHHETNPEAPKICNGVYSVKMKIKKPIPNFLPALGLKIRIYYRDCILLCPNCYRVHPREYCMNAEFL